MVVHLLDGDPSGIKEKIDEGVPDADLKSTSGISKLLEFFKSIYEKDSLSDGFEKYIAFERFRRSQGKSIQEFIPEWTTAYKKAKNIGCVLPDKVLALKLLDAANLSQLERNLVLTGVDYTDAKILEQMQTALKKFIGRTAIGQNEDQRNVDSTYLTADNFETVLLSKGWTKPRGGGRGGGRGRGGKREREEPSEPSQEKRRKNYLGRDGKISKCFKCTCKHETDCDCECTFHLAHRCPGTGTREKADLGLFMQSNVETFFVTDDGKDDEFVLYIQTFAATPEIDIPPAAPEVADTPSSQPTDHETSNPTSAPEPINNSVPDPEQISEEYDLALIVEDVCLFTQNTDNIAFIDSACPTTVAGENWFKKYIHGLPAGRKIKLSPSDRMYKFGGGERKKSKELLNCLVSWEESLGQMFRQKLSTQKYLF